MLQYGRAFNQECARGDRQGGSLPNCPEWLVVNRHPKILERLNTGPRELIKIESS